MLGRTITDISALVKQINEYTGLLMVVEIFLGSGFWLRFLQNRRILKNQEIEYQAKLDNEVLEQWEIDAHEAKKWKKRKTIMAWLFAIAFTLLIVSLTIVISIPEGQTSIGYGDSSFWDQLNNQRQNQQASDASCSFTASVRGKEQSGTQVYAEKGDIIHCTLWYRNDNPDVEEIWTYLEHTNGLSLIPASMIISSDINPGGVRINDTYIIQGVALGEYEQGQSVWLSFHMSVDGVINQSVQLSLYSNDVLIQKTIEIIVE